MKPLFEYLVSKDSSFKDEFETNRNVQLLHDFMIDSSLPVKLLNKYEECLHKMIEYNKASAYLDDLYECVVYILSSSNYKIFDGDLPSIKTVKFEYVDYNDTSRITIGSVNDAKRIELHIGRNKAGATLYSGKDIYYWYAYTWNKTDMSKNVVLLDLNEEKTRHLETAIEKELLKR